MWSRGRMTRRSVCSTRCAGPVPGAPAALQAQHPEGGGMDHLQHYGWEEWPNPGGGGCWPGAHPGGGPERGERRADCCYGWL